MTEQFTPIALFATKEYQATIGKAITYWADWESRVDRHLIYLRLDPDVEALEAHMPLPYAGRKGRAALFMKSVEVAYKGCPVLIARYRKMIQKSLLYAKARGRLVHGIWVWSDINNREDGEIMIHEKRKGVVFEAKAKDINELADDIGRLSSEFALISIALAIPDSHLTSPEIQALREFHQKHIQGRPDRKLLPDYERQQHPLPSFRS